MPRDQESNESLHSVLAHLDENRAELVFYYRIMITFFALVVASQLVLGAWFVWHRTGDVSGNTFYPFLTVNIAAVVAELLLVRIGFMLAARAGQIRDLTCALKIADSDIDINRLNLSIQPFNNTRRNENDLKVLDIESVASSVGSKLQGKSAS